MKTDLFTTDEQRWVAVAERNADALGHFYYAVKTTGIYCRPTCASRQPLRDNVSFFVTADAAAQAGFRPCKRCRPTDQSMSQGQIEMVVKACRLMEESVDIPSAEQLADAASMSKFHFQRVFKLITGLTPRSYATGVQAQRLRDGLQSAESVTDAMYEAGFSSSGRFYEASSDMLGMKPGEHRQKGRHQVIRFAVGQSNLGAVLVAATDVGLCCILLGDEPDALVVDLQRRFANAELVGADDAFEEWVALVVGFVETPKLGLDLPLDVQGTAFQQRVWQALRQIPLGSTASYTEIAKAVGAPKSARAIAQACGANPLAVAIPCHRVVRSDGNLSGYRWGIERKRALLDRERIE